MDTQQIHCTKDFLDIDFGTLKLAKGHSLPVQVVDANGKAVAGATIERAMTIRFKARLYAPTLAVEQCYATCQLA